VASPGSLVLFIVSCFTQEIFAKARAMDVSVASMDVTTLRCIGLMCVWRLPTSVYRVHRA